MPEEKAEKSAIKLEGANGDSSISRLNGRPATSDELKVSK
jgi:hypothetical protein